MSEQPEVMADIARLLKEERDLVFAARPLEIAQQLVEGGFYGRMYFMKMA